MYRYYRDFGQHHAPHIHVMYQNEQAVFGIPGGELLEGSLQGRMLRKVRASIELYDEELQERWERAVRGEPITRID